MKFVRHLRERDTCTCIATLACIVPGFLVRLRKTLYATRTWQSRIWICVKYTHIWYFNLPFDWLIDWLIDFLVFYDISAMFQPYNGSLPFEYMNMCEYKSVLSMNLYKNIYINFLLIIFDYAYLAKQERRLREFCGSKFR